MWRSLLYRECSGGSCLSLWFLIPKSQILKRCYGITQQNHHRAIEVIDDQLGQTFIALDRKSAEEQLTSLDARAYVGRPREYSAYRSIKGLITQAYFASEAGKLLEQEWVAVPGRWDPSVEI